MSIFLDAQIVFPLFLPPSMWNREETLKMPSETFFLCLFTSGSTYNPRGVLDLGTSAAQSPGKPD